MKLQDYLFLVFRQFTTRKLRTFLTMLAIGVGIGTMFVLVSFVYGMQDVITKRIAPMETLLTLDVTPGKIAQIDNNAIKKLKDVPGVEDVTPMISLSGQGALQGTNTYADLALYGVEPSFIRYDGMKIVQGENIAANQNDALITEAAAKLLFPSGDILGKSIEVKVAVPVGENSSETVVKELPKAVKIVGVTEEAETSGLYVNLESFRSVTTDVPYSAAKIKVDAGDHIQVIKNAIMASGFEVQAVYDTIEETTKLFNYLRAIFAIFGLIGLFVAAIGMFNTLTISLLERTRDIGFMKAFGARNRNVQNLFLTEAALMGIGGGIVGVTLGSAICYLSSLAVHIIMRRAGAPDLTVFISPLKFVFSVIVFSGFLGFLTGIYPARRASRISALEAIRYE